MYANGTRVLDERSASIVLDGVVAEYGLVDSEQALRWLVHIEQYAVERGLAEPNSSIARVIAVSQRANDEARWFSNELP